MTSCGSAIGSKSLATCEMVGLSDFGFGILPEPLTGLLYFTTSIPILTNNQASQTLPTIKKMETQRITPTIPLIKDLTSFVCSFVPQKSLQYQVIAWSYHNGVNNISFFS